MSQLEFRCSREVVLPRIGKKSHSGGKSETFRPRQFMLMTAALVSAVLSVERSFRETWRLILLALLQDDKVCYRL